MYASAEQPQVEFAEEYSGLQSSAITITFENLIPSQVQSESSLRSTGRSARAANNPLLKETLGNTIVVSFLPRTARCHVQSLPPNSSAVLAIFANYPEAEYPCGDSGEAGEGTDSVKRFLC